VEEKRLQGIGLIVHAIDLRIAQVEQGVDDPSQGESLELLREMRRRWEAQADGQ
jgi:hypothetical protein